MQGYQQRLIFFALFITITYAQTEINSFATLGSTGTENNPTSVYANYVGFSADVTKCPTPECRCEIKAKETEDGPFPFPIDNGKGSAGVSNLESNKLYTFVLTCHDNATHYVTKESKVTTDSVRPSAPQKVEAALESQNIRITWSSPSTDTAPITNYRVIIDDRIVADNIPNSQTTYLGSEVYTYNTTHKIVVEACYLNNQKHLFCSFPNGNEYTFIVLEPTTTTTSTTSTTTTSTATISSTTAPKSAGIHSYSISISMIIFSLFLFMKIN